ncbi:sugar ABC transporter substrate-binding protein [Clostridium sp. AF18-27]|uniref:Monosaccharide ABC transporter substrate-binding protein, CUT2 family (TC 3.A.1.2.-) n=1 Tax=Enterocloster lavalensis TaxID=460384 RepID=A0A1I0GU97_9FIRM|nr:MULTISPECIES: ABC transporter substrate-binding protein [Enterocloster]RHR56266.1 sugar ABC transporter substrate-binding protein [Clostridium sp. AF18-27]MCB6341337.1 ABC transporter substrate-binding protein [Enterocloster lavalensis]MDR3755959.1 ABC transporter substrate-binding protein [Enterocloster sp.]PST30677.1 sugar ABC transporter substrate-binding protein [Enterocloster lavalensis]SET74685.1 monosaccharide ABC transporter substrate-binding protein, CUT2 family (TC 3.A.1.2.-) [Ent
MKKSKWIAMLVGGAMICSLAACGGQSSSAPASTAAPTEKTADTTAAEAGDTTEAADAAAEDKGEGKGYVIGFSNSYNGNTYRQAMEGYLKEAAEELQKTGEVSEVIFAESNQNNSTQVQQIENFILQGVDAIIIDPGSATALNGAIQEASDAGIPCIIINDGPVSSEAELCYQINFDTIAQMGYLTEYVCEAIGGKGNIIELRGTAGSEFDNIAHEGVLKVLEKYPDIKVVAEIYTDWTGSKAQSELASVLPTLDKVDGVVTQGGDSYAAVQAFQSAGLDLPIIGGDNRGYFLKWWANEAPEGYDTVSVSSNPWDGATGLYVAVDILDGMDVPKEMIHPFGIVTKDEVKDYADVADEAICCPTFDRDWVRENLYK